MVGQQMIMEARLRNRFGQESVTPHPRTRARHSRLSAPSMMYSIFKPLIAIGNILRSRLHLPE